MPQNVPEKKMSRPRQTPVATVLSSRRTPSPTGSYRLSKVAQRRRRSEQRWQRAMKQIRADMLGIDMPKPRSGFEPTIPSLKTPPACEPTPPPVENPSHAAVESYLDQFQAWIEARWRAE